jgi:hypothetical protein
MKNQFKLEIGALVLFTILLLLARMDILPNFIHLFFALLLATYFFPVRLVLKKETDASLPQVLSSFVICASIVLISLLTTVGNEIQFLAGAGAMLSLLNLLGAIYYFSKSARKMAILHMSAQFVLAVYFF